MDWGSEVGTVFANLTEETAFNRAEWKKRMIHLTVINPRTSNKGFVILDLVMVVAHYS